MEKKNFESPTRRKSSHHKHRSSNNRQYPENRSHHKNSAHIEESVTRAPLVVFAQCLICDTGISNENYALKIDDKDYIHFECAIKKLKDIAQTTYSSYGKRLKYTYMGNNTFAIYTEQGGHPYAWKILQKITLDKLFQKNKIDQ